MDVWVKVIVLAAGGALGTNARYWLGIWMVRGSTPRFPWATLFVNVSGSFAIGFLATALARWAPQQNVRLLVLTGFLGGYTTFSAFAFESLVLVEKGQPGLMLANTAGSVVAGVAAVALGAWLARALI